MSLPTVIAQDGFLRDRTGQTGCPSNNGARNYLAGSYSPSTNRYYISVNDVCTPKAGEMTDRLGKI